MPVEHPDPQTSPFAKGTVCATDFLQHEEMTRGLKFLEETFPEFTQVLHAQQRLPVQRKAR